MNKITELNQKRTVASAQTKPPNYEWYLLAKKNIDFYTMGDPNRAQNFLNVIAEYEKKYAIK